MRALTIVAALAAALAFPAVVHADADIDGCQVVLSHPTATFVEVHRDGLWETYEVVEGLVDLLGTYAPGVYEVRWTDGSDVIETETIVLACEVPNLPPQDPNEEDICQWIEPDEFVEGCNVQISSAETPAADGTVSPPSSRSGGSSRLPPLPETSTATFVVCARRW